MAEDSLLFIDANIYLDLYRESQNKEIFDQLKELSTEIFSTQQVVDEVRRRRKDIVLKILDRCPKARLEMKLTAWPEHLLDLKVRNCNPSQMKMLEVSSQWFRTGMLLP